MGTADGAAAGFGIGMVIVVALMALAVAGFVFWIIALLEVARTPDHAYRAVGTDKTTWVLVVAIVGWIGALIYWFGARQRLVQIGAVGPGAAGGAYARSSPPGVPYQPATPPGWYPNPQADGLRWWDGRQWTDHVA